MVHMRFRIGLAILSFFCFFSPAEARPRDEVMSQVFHCGVISDSRQWLDCVYGSAQPLRAELGLPPVTLQQSRLVDAPPVGGSISDQSTRDQVLADAMRCDSFAADRMWLDCFYAATNVMRTELGLTINSVTQSDVGQKTTTDKTKITTFGNTINQDPNSFGLTPKANFLTRFVKSRLASYEFDRYGIFTVRLTNGQVWRQVSGDTSYAHWKQPPEKYAVTIRKGALGSYNLTVKDNPGLFKVERVF